MQEMLTPKYGSAGLLELRLLAQAACATFRRDTSTCVFAQHWQAILDFLDRLAHFPKQLVGV